MSKVRCFAMEVHCFDLRPFNSRFTSIIVLSLDLHLEVESSFQGVDCWRKFRYQLAQLQPQVESHKALDPLHCHCSNRFPSRSLQRRKCVLPKHRSFFPPDKLRVRYFAVTKGKILDVDFTGINKMAKGIFCLRSP